MAVWFVPLHGLTATQNPFPRMQRDQDTGTDCQHGAAQEVQGWTKGMCPNCGEAEAEVDPDGILWCPACGYSKKGCYT